MFMMLPGILIPALFLFLIFGLGIRFFKALSDDSGRLTLRDRWQIFEKTRLAVPFSSRPRSAQGRIFRAAYKHRGRLTISDIVLETDLSIREAEEIVNGMVDSTHVRMEVEDNGLVIYEFPEILARFEST